jgi:hypothetical protein
MLNFSIVNWGLGQDPQAEWRLPAVASQWEAVTEFLAAARGTSFERLELRDDDTGWTVAEAVQFSDRVEIVIHQRD